MFREANLLIGRLLRGAGSGAPRHVEQLDARLVLSVGFESLGVVASDYGPVVSADFDDDGDIDFATSSGSRNGIELLNIFLNNGSGGFSGPTEYHYGFAIPFATDPPLIASDLDNDGDADIVAMGAGVFENRGDGTFENGTPLVGFGITATQAAVLNFDNNNLPDMVFVNQAGQVTIAINQGGFNFTLGPQAQVDATDKLVGVGRVNNDSRDDLVFWDEAGESVFTLLSTTLNLSTGPTRNGVETRPIAAYTNPDSFIDLVWVSGTGADAAIEGSFGAVSGFGAVTTRRDADSFGYTRVDSLADVDNDGKDDLLVLRENATTREWAAILGTGAGEWDGIAARIVQVPLGGSPGSVLPVDVTGEDRADVLHFDGSQIRVLRSVIGPAIGVFAGPSGEQVPGRNIAMGVGGLSEASGRDITAVRFYMDSNGNGRLDQKDALLGTATPAGTAAALVAPLPDGGPAGEVKFFAVAEDAVAMSTPSETTLTLWTRVFFPEGWRDINNVNEHVPIVNDNDVPVQVRVVLRYETGERDQVYIEDTIPARSRWGFTTAERGNQNYAVRPDEGYAIEVQSSLPIGAQLARYDTFGVSGGGAGPGGQGESFTNVSANRWAFPDVSTRTLDFLLFYNPFGTTANVTITFTNNGGSQVQITRTIEGFRRSGAALQLENVLTGLTDYSAVVESDQPIAASHSRYQPGTGRGLVSLGQPLDVAGRSVRTFAIIGLEFRDGMSHRTTLFNPSDAPISVDIRGDYDNGDPSLRTIVLNPLQRLSINLEDDAPGTAASGFYRITSTGEVHVANESIDADRGDSLETGAASFAATRWGIGDGWLDPNSLGENSEAVLSIYNPSEEDQIVTLRFLFLDGTSTTTQVTVGAGTGSNVKLHETSALVDRPNLNWYSTVVSAASPIVVSMTHWDLYQPGGWTTLGSPLAAPVALEAPTGIGG